MRSIPGQASADYLAVLAVVGVLLAGAGALAPPPDLPGAIVHHARVALCIVGGDICRAADARRAGLEPCVVRVRDGTRSTSMTILFVRAGQQQGYAVEQRSDGTVRLVATEGAELGASGRAGLQIGPYMKFKAGGGVATGWRSGVAWELADGAALRRLLVRARGRPAALADPIAREHYGVPPPAERFFEGGEMRELKAGGDAGGLDLPLIGARGRTVLGRRVRGDATSWYLDASGVGPRLFGGVIPAVALRGTSGWTLEVAADAEGRARALRLTGTVPEGPSREVRLEAALDLRRPANARAARDLLGLRGLPSPLELARARAVGRHILEAGRVERRVYRIRRRPSDADAGVNFGIAGAEHADLAHERTLVDAHVLGVGRPARREDCL